MQANTNINEEKGQLLIYINYRQHVTSMEFILLFFLVKRIKLQKSTQCCGRPNSLCSVSLAHKRQLEDQHDLQYT